jgi:hypothetical protein
MLGGEPQQHCFTTFWLWKLNFSNLAKESEKISFIFYFTGNLNKNVLGIYQKPAKTKQNEGKLKKKLIIYAICDFVSLFDSERKRFLPAHSQNVWVTRQILAQQCIMCGGWYEAGGAPVMCRYL